MNYGKVYFKFIYIFALWGMHIFADIKLQNNQLNQYHNFKNLIYALLSNLGLISGIPWGQMMHDTTRQFSSIND